MNVIEIIRLRLAYRGDTEKVLALHRNISEQLPAGTATLYRSARTDTDWAIWLCVSESEVGPNGSSIGYQLAEHARRQGLVHHDVWREVPPSNQTAGPDPTDR